MDFCATSRSREQLQQKIYRHVRFLTSLTDAQLQAAIGNMDLDDDGDELSDCEEEIEDWVEEGEMRTHTSAA